MTSLFPTDVPRKEWQQFRAEGFAEDVCGIVFRRDEATRGMPLGGIGTGCLDLNCDGKLGLCSIFNSFVPPRELNSPLLNLRLGARSIPLTTSPEKENSCKQIHYWGHYPIADLEYEVDAPLTVGLRAWSPFLPGDAPNSNTPAVFFDVSIRNGSAESQSGSIACLFPGPSTSEARVCYVSEVTSSERCGLELSWDGGSYTLCLLDSEIVSGTPVSCVSPDGRGASVEVGFTLAPGEERSVQFILAWFAPRWAGSDAHHFRHAYATRFGEVSQVCDFAIEHKAEWLMRIISWQSEIYNNRNLPIWLRDQLINVLHTIPEDAFWAADSIPAENWYRPEGLFGLTESPRTTPHMCNPSDWYGILPIAFFFPELLKSLLRLYVHFQLPTGEIPLGIGEGADFFHPAHHLFQVMNSCVHIHLIDRLWQRTQDEGILREFYSSASQALGFMGTLDRNGDGLPELDADPIPNQYYGAWPWYGVAVHVSGFWLAALLMMERMAGAVGDGATRHHCRLWLDKARKTLEIELGSGDSYLLYRDRAGQRISDTVLANQLAGQWCTHLHSLPGAFPAERVPAVLDKIEATCVQATRHGAINSARPGGSLDHTATPHSDGIFTGECLCLAATLAYENRRQRAEEVAERMMRAIIVQDGVGWELPNILDVNGRAIHGDDFYQLMILWSLPLAFEGQGIREACSSGGFVDRIVAAAGT